jgi:tryptophanase
MILIEDVRRTSAPAARPTTESLPRSPHSLGDHACGQLRRLCSVVGLDAVTEGYACLLSELLGPAAAQPLGTSPVWPSEISDDHTPVEYSMTFDADRMAKLRFLAEPGSHCTDLKATMEVGRQTLQVAAERYRFSLARLFVLEDLFFPPDPQGRFGLWVAVELSPDGIPDFKVYLNPAAHGQDRASEVVQEALGRLGFGDVYERLRRTGLARGNGLDSLYIFSMDVGSHWKRPRVKVYVRHERACLEDIRRAAAAVPGVRAESVAIFTQLVAGTTRFACRPIISSYGLFDEDRARAGSYTVHVPIRNYVQHDAQAYHHTASALRCRGIDCSLLDRALDAVTDRALSSGVGLISYAGLVCSPRPRRMTVYLSSEAYAVTPPRHAPIRERARSTYVSPLLPLPAREVAPVLMEPYRIKVVEPIPVLSREERAHALEAAGYNLFDLRADQVTIDLLSDSGTGALSAAQLGASMIGDESYAGARSFHRFRDAVERLTSYPHILPVHQGRAAERILFSTSLQPGKLTLSNTHFDTTRANVELAGAEARDIPCAEAHDLDTFHPFKGNIDLDALQRILDSSEGNRVAMVVVTITNNGGGGQPVSMENLAATSRICRERGVPLILDAARFAENAWLVTQREPGYRGWTPRAVAEAAFRLADGCVASMKKDGLVNIGGFIGLQDEELARRCELLLIATEGFSTYGGLAGRDLDMLAQGLAEVTEPDYLRSRAAMAGHLAELARAAGVAIVEPPGLHAVYLNAGRLLQHIPPHRFPGHALACALYLEGGIRSAELGSLYLGEEDEDGNPLVAAPYELVRLAIPRRVYTQSHIEYVGQVLAYVAANTGRIPGYRVTERIPLLRHFKVKLEPVEC